MEKWFGFAIESLGGSVEEAKEGEKDILDRLLSILEKVIQINSLLAQKILDTATKYIKSPTALVSGGKAWVRDLYIKATAISIALK